MAAAGFAARLPRRARCEHVFRRAEFRPARRRRRDVLRAACACRCFTAAGVAAAHLAGRDVCGVPPCGAQGRRVPANQRRSRANLQAPRTAPAAVARANRRCSRSFRRGSRSPQAVGSITTFHSRSERHEQFNHPPSVRWPRERPSLARRSCPVHASRSRRRRPRNCRTPCRRPRAPLSIPATSPASWRRCGTKTSSSPTRRPAGSTWRARCRCIAARSSGSPR